MRLAVALLLVAFVSVSVCAAEPTQIEKEVRDFLLFSAVRTRVMRFSGAPKIRAYFALAVAKGMHHARIELSAQTGERHVTARQLRSWQSASIRHCRKSLNS